MFNKTHRRRTLRTSSAVLFTSSDDDDDKHPNSTDMDMLFSTPHGSSQTAEPLDGQAATITTDALKITIPKLAFVSSASRTFETIDLVSPMLSPSEHLPQACYVPYTLNPSSQIRALILPTYPCTIADDLASPHLLLVNIPIEQLSMQERAHRRTGEYPCAFIVVDTQVNSFMVQYYHVYFAPLLERFHVDLSILDHSYMRMKTFIEFYREAITRILGPQETLDHQYRLNENEYAPLLEFYLQLDVDLFYMKTCAFRGAQPRSIAEGLFCQASPECRYTTRPCDNCALCSPSGAPNAYRTPTLRVNSYQRHRFVNGYESILNCPASCTTKNIIYALTCPCGHYDFVGETRGLIGDRLNSHQFHTNRLIHEALIGEKNYELLYDVKTVEMRKKDRMRLYRHPMRCPQAIQLFLDYHPHYWRFVPQTVTDAHREDHRPATPINNSRGNETSQRFVDALPKPPVGYEFSKLQIEKQHEFFRLKLHKERVSYNRHIYGATLIAVLPLNTSDLFRQMVHSLFVTHSESKLNTIGHLFQNTSPIDANEVVWCVHLVRRLLA